MHTISSKMSSLLAPLSLIIISTLLITTRAANFNIRNNCHYVVWDAAYPGGGLQLNPNQQWSLDVAPGTQYARIWGRTNCNSDASVCGTGDCGRSYCTGYGRSPNTVAEFALNQYQNYDYFGISLIDGFNIPMEFGPTVEGGYGCKRSRCTADIIGQCPNPLRFPGGCNNPCTVFRTNEYCCYQASEPCNPTDYSRFFKNRCPTSLSYKGDQTGNRSCPSGTNYKVVFCP
ncbi:thaumatin-like protein 1 [Daucus carota subsp. sativus]|uniref:thaumatin-like protein 1 n=1 Tax=Daucus carota subsp. sativus TaxID=79200 RepID=UPI0030828CD5